MVNNQVINETTVNDGHSVTVPSQIREALDIEPGDKLRWHVNDEGELSVEVVKQQYGAFDDLEPVDIGEETNAVEIEKEFGEY
jgi:AbrB family looped-hinge helix DNA binding protein